MATYADQSLRAGDRQTFTRLIPHRASIHESTVFDPVLYSTAFDPELRPKGGSSKSDPRELAEVSILWLSGGRAETGLFFDTREANVVHRHVIGIHSHRFVQDRQQ